MIWLIFGVVLWSALHLVPTLAVSLRQPLRTSWGDGPYRAVFAVIIIASIVLIVIGWRSTPEVLLYQLPFWTRSIGFALMIVAFILFGASHYPTVIKRYIRHPQLTSVIVWGISHLLTNGTTRAVILFGGLAVWALIEIPLINARDGAFVKPEAPGLATELKGLAISAAIFVAALLLHPYFAGVSPLPR